VTGHAVAKPRPITTVISRGTLAQRKLHRSIVSRMAPTTIYGVSIRPANRHWSPPFYPAVSGRLKLDM